MKIISKITEIFLNIIILIVLIFVCIAGTYVIQTRIMNKEYANLFGYSAFEVITGSMSPTIEIGDVVIVKIKNTFKENDIIVYKQEGSFITHRVIKIDGDEINTKGDANNSEDKAINFNQVLGQVVYVVPKFATWKKVITTPAVLGLIIITVILFGLVFSIENNDDKKNNNKKKGEKNDKQEKTEKNN